MPTAPRRIRARPKRRATSNAYGVDVETKEFLTRDGAVVRMCAPVFAKVGGSAARVRKLGS